MDELKIEIQTISRICYEEQLITHNWSLVNSTTSLSLRDRTDGAFSPNAEHLAFRTNPKSGLTSETWRKLDLMSCGSSKVGSAWGLYVRNTAHVFLTETLKTQHSMSEGFTMVMTDNSWNMENISKHLTEIHLSINEQLLEQTLPFLTSPISYNNRP